MVIYQHLALKTPQVAILGAVSLKSELTVSKEHCAYAWSPGRFGLIAL
jgi:hypothetical protein